MKIRPGRSGGAGGERPGLWGRAFGGWTVGRSSVSRVGGYRIQNGGPEWRWVPDRTGLLAKVPGLIERASEGLRSPGTVETVGRSGAGGRKVVPG